MSFPGDARSMAQRLREEVLANYDSRIPNSPFIEVHKTLGFFTYAFARRGGNESVILPTKLAQLLVSLAQDGFEAAAGYQDQHMQSSLASALNTIWFLFTVTLIRWIKGRKETRLYGGAEDYYYGCFQIPEWFIEEAKVSPVNGAYKDYEAFSSP